jgi:hypothetical protein
MERNLSTANHLSGHISGHISLPAHLARWVNAEIQSSLLDESGLNCGSCVRFLGKCCTFQPFVANYLVGEKAGSAENYFVSPLGLLATQQYQMAHRKSADGSRGWDLICSFYERNSGRCSRWQTRPAECAAHFCESTHGSRGNEFWQKLSVQFNQIEVAVAQMAMVEFGFSPKVIGEQISWLVLPPEKLNMRKIWGDWFGEENLFFSKCAAWAAKISRDQVEEWLAEK